jgi:hypothetical protein
LFAFLIGKVKSGRYILQENKKYLYQFINQWSRGDFMKKILALLGTLVTCSTFVSADFGDMMDGFGMMGGSFGMGIYGAIYFAIGAFIFSAIFWLTHNWLANCKKR